MYLVGETNGSAEGCEYDPVMAGLESVYAFLYARVGNRSDAEDLVQEVALKALPRLRPDLGEKAVQSYLFATARSALAAFWRRRLGLPVSELDDEAWLPPPLVGPPSRAVERVEGLLSGLSASYRLILELRFLRGYSLKETAAEMGITVGSAKVTQLRALRAAAKVTVADLAGQTTIWQTG
jgi:RNA polymerase sigma factor (sigma-70 family)